MLVGFTYFLWDRISLAITNWIYEINLSDFLIFNYFWLLNEFVWFNCLYL